MDDSGPVELLERALAYTRVRLVGVTPAALDRATPCAEWDLRRLLAHMEDSLDAFLEAAHGTVAVTPVPATGGAARVEALRHKACSLLAAWTQGPSTEVYVGEARIDGRLLAATAALEITVHGWDVGCATGSPTDIPPALARELLDVARIVVGDADRGSRFGPARAVPPDAPYDVRLLAFLGR